MRIYGDIYEHSPWIAEAAWDHREGDNLDQTKILHACMKQAVMQADHTLQLALIRAHPDLACATGELTAASDSEQAGAGLKHCSPEEFTEFQTLNADYKAKFGFPFIVAVKGLTRHDILLQFRARMHRSVAQEFNTALEQIHKIALFRLEALT